MNNINLQNKAKLQQGKIEKYYFKNGFLGLKKTLYHRIYIPIVPFDSGLEYVEQPEDTEIVFEWYDLGLSNPDSLNGLDLSHENYPNSEASIYIGSAHNICDIQKLQISHLKENIFQLKGILFVNFENEGVGENESFEFDVEAKLTYDIF